MNVLNSSASLTLTSTVHLNYFFINSKFFDSKNTQMTNPDLIYLIDDSYKSFYNIVI